jgi:hypothetical protein
MVLTGVLVATTLGCVGTPGVTAPASSSPRQSSAASEDTWEAFCEALKPAGVTVAAHAPQGSEIDRAEGYRFLTRMLRLGLSGELEYADTDRPVIWQSETPTLKFGGNNPDQLYYDANIDGAATYHITGPRGTTPLIEISVYEGRLGRDATSKYVGHLTERELQVDPAGQIHIVVSPDPHPGNWIQTTPESNFVFIRQYRFDWREEPAELTIQREGQSEPPPPLTLDRLNEGLQRAATFVNRNAILWSQISNRFAAAASNGFAPPIRGPEDAGDATLPQGHILQAGSFRLEPEQALIVEFTPPKELIYWGFQLLNHWYESLDYRYRSVHTNRYRAKVGPDGRVRIVVAHRDPGVDNWVDTAGHREGGLLIRWTRPRPDTVLPPVSTQVVKWSDASR